MDTMTITCSCCGTLLTIPEGAVAAECSACGTPNARPRSTDTALEALQRATRQRLACDFSGAELSYQQVLLVNPDEHEALWGRLLCHYGVEYVEDPANRRLLPTVHTVRVKPLQEQPDFRSACDFAPDAVRAQYERDAAYIDEAQARIRDLAASCKPYDVFICHKTTGPDGGKTEDFNRAAQLYHFLKDQGMEVFFAPESLSSAAGANYEAGIYHALQTARTMLVVCSDSDRLNSPWVRSEWSRFLELVDAEPGRQLIPLLYEHFSASSLPAPFRYRKLQGLDMTDITSPQKLLNILRSVQAKKAEAAAPKPADQPKPSGTAVSASTGEVVFEFPRLIPEWKRAPHWKICHSTGKKKVLAPFRWGKSSLLPLTEPVDVTVREERVSAWWPLFITLGTIATFLVSFFGTFFIYGMGALVATPLYVIWYVKRIKRHYRKHLRFTANPGKRYRLHWDENEKLAVEEL